MRLHGGHIPVLYDETLAWLDLHPGQIVVDGTLGACGHAQGILKRILPGGVLIGIDRDAEAIGRAEKLLKPYHEHVHLVHSDFRRITEVLGALGFSSIDRAMLDLGVSSYQLEDADRGFSYMQDARLDMRMDQSDEHDALYVVNKYTGEELGKVLSRFGEEKWSTRIARAIVKEREKSPIETTSQLVGIIRDAIPEGARRNGPHPAKRTFQAIRIEVNNELDGLTEALSEYVGYLRPGGRLAVITFHSLEDRIVKKEFVRLADPCICPPDLPVCACGLEPVVRIVTRKPIVASNEELTENPRARSAKLRVVEKI